MVPQLEIRIGGISFRTADIALREKLSLGPNGAHELIGRLRGHGMSEVSVLSTCNRFEILVAGPLGYATELCENEVPRVLANEFNLGHGEIADRMYFHQQEAAAFHLFRVACGLDSMIVGEPQILGQLKDAYDIAQKCGGVGAILHRLFHRAFHVAKLTRTETAVGRHVVSFGSVARDVAEQVYGELEKLSVLLVGGGEMGRLLLRQLQAAGVKSFFVANRTVERACAFAGECNGVALSLERIPEVLHSADVIIGAAARDAGSEPFVCLADARAALRQRNGIPQLYLDLGVPRNFAADIQGLSDAFLYNIDDFEQIVRRNVILREEEVEKAEEYISQEVSRFMRWVEIYPLTEMFQMLGEVGAFRDPVVGRTMKLLRREKEYCDRVSELKVHLERLSDWARETRADHESISVEFKNILVAFERSASRRGV